MGEPILVLTYAIVFGTIGLYTFWLIRRDRRHR